VPAGKYVFFQLLDEKKKMVQSMRSGVIVQPGETNGCIGCHEDRLSAPPPMKSLPDALKKPPHQMNGWFGHTRTFSYIRDIQPIFDARCIECHDFGSEASDKLLLAADRNPYFNASYVDIHVKKMVSVIGGGPADIQQAYSWGSHASKLVKAFESGKERYKVSDEELEKIYTWVDMNAVYYPEYESAYPDNPAGRSPLTADQLERLGQLTDIDFKRLGDHRRQYGPQISFERPELSPCLVTIKDDPAKYKEALAIITSGKEQLESLPRGDMEGFVPSAEQLTQLEKYKERRNIADEILQAINEGEKKYDQ
jgi:hypothetical protein